MNELKTRKIAIICFCSSSKNQELNLVFQELSFEDPTTLADIT